MGWGCLTSTESGVGLAISHCQIYSISQALMQIIDVHNISVQLMVPCICSNGCFMSQTGSIWYVGSVLAV